MAKEAVVLAAADFLLAFNMRLSQFFQQTKIFVAGYSGGFEIVTNDEDRNFMIGGNDHGSRNTRFYIRAVTALLPGELKTSGEKNPLQCFPIHGRKLGHTPSGCRHGGMFLHTNPIRTLPALAIKMVSGIFQNIRQRALGIGRLQKQSDRLIHRQSRRLRSRAATGHIHRHGMGSKLGAITPDLYYVINIHIIVRANEGKLHPKLPAGERF